MSLYVIYQDIKAHGVETAFLIYLILKLIDITPININPWQSIVKAIRRFFTGDLAQKIDAIEKNQNDIVSKFEKTQEIMKERFQTIDSQMSENFNSIEEELAFSCAMTSRYRLIRTADELSNGLEPSHDHLEILLQDDLPTYQKYCDTHPDFVNHKGRVSVQLLLTYEQMLIRKEAEEKYKQRGKNNEDKLEG